MATLLVIMKSVSLDLVGCSLRPVVQIWGHLCKVQFKDWEIWKLNPKRIPMNPKRTPMLLFKIICLFLVFKLHLLLCQSDSSTVTLGEPGDSNERWTDGAAMWAVSQPAPCRAWAPHRGVSQLGNICTQGSWSCSLAVQQWTVPWGTEEQGTWGEGFIGGGQHY